MEIKKENYSKDLNQVIEFMETTLSKELPVVLINIDYFTLAIFNHKENLAYKRLYYNLTSSTLNDIHDGYYALINNNALNAIKPTKKIIYDTNLLLAFELAEKEREITGYPKITTEHVVLAILNHDFKVETRLRKLFDKAGITYNILLEKVTKDIDMMPQYNDTSIEQGIDIGDENGDTNIIGVDTPTKKVVINVGTDIDPLKANDMIKEMMGISNPIIESSKKKKKSGQYPCIAQYCTDITELAKQGKIERLVGRNNEIDTIIRTLGRRKKNNVIILGPEGSGKTTIAEGLAYKIIDGDVPSFLQHKKLVSLDMTALIAGTTLRGMFEERVKTLLEEIKESGKHILLIDNIGEILSDKGKNDYDIAAMISHALDNGEIQVVGTSDFKSYRNTFDKNPSLGRKFSKIIIDAPTNKEALTILDGNKSYYENFHNVKFDNDAIETCVLLAEKYITDRNLPDSAIDIMDEAGSYYSALYNPNNNDEVKDYQNKLTYLRNSIAEYKRKDDYAKADELAKEEKTLSNQLINKIKELDKLRKENPNPITKEDIYNIVSSKTGIPINKLSVNDKKKIATMADRLKTEVIGQDDAIDTICQSIKRNRIGLQNSKCVFSGMLIGTSGTGKTLIAKKLAKELFGSEKALVRFDMSEYNDKTSVNKLIGSNPGYVGYDEGGQLTEIIKNKKYCVILLDEIEKADPEIYNIFLQVLDEGFLSDNTGQKIDFKNTIILFTSNVGTKIASDFAKGLAFDSDPSLNKKRLLGKELKKKFPPEFLNRLDNVIYFNNLSNDDLTKIIKLELNKMKDKLNKLDFKIEYDLPVIDYILNIIKDEKDYGARPIIRAIQDEIENKITDMIIENEYSSGQTFYIEINNDNLCINTDRIIS